MIAAYRGLAKNKANPDNSTFYFLKYANYDKDPLDEFEPLLIRMTQNDIDNAKGVYTFKNVELNYDGDFDDGKGGKYNKEYTAKEAKERMGKGILANISTAAMIQPPTTSSRSAATMISISQERCINRTRIKPSFHRSWRLHHSEQYLREVSLKQEVRTQGIPWLFQAEAIRFICQGQYRHLSR